MNHDQSGFYVLWSQRTFRVSINGLGRGSDGTRTPDEFDCDDMRAAREALIHASARVMSPLYAKSLTKLADLIADALETK